MIPCNASTKKVIRTYLVGLCLKTADDNGGKTPYWFITELVNQHREKFPFININMLKKAIEYEKKAHMRSDADAFTVMTPDQCPDPSPVPLPASSPIAIPPEEILVSNITPVQSPLNS